MRPSQAGIHARERATPDLLRPGGHMRTLTNLTNQTVLR